MDKNVVVLQGKYRPVGTGAVAGVGVGASGQLCGSSHALRFRIFLNRKGAPKNNRTFTHAILRSYFAKVSKVTVLTGYVTHVLRWITPQTTEPYTSTMRFEG